MSGDFPQSSAVSGWALESVLRVQVRTRRRPAQAWPLSTRTRTHPARDHRPRSFCPVPSTAVAREACQCAAGRRREMRRVTTHGTPTRARGSSRAHFRSLTRGKIPSLGKKTGSGSHPTHGRRPRSRRAGRCVTSRLGPGALSARAHTCFLYSRLRQNRDASWSTREVLWALLLLALDLLRRREVEFKKLYSNRERRPIRRGSARSYKSLLFLAC
jgi:hypothetical protein